MDYQFDFSFLQTDWSTLLGGTWLTLRMTFFSILFGFAAGAACAVVHVFGRPGMRRVVTAYVEVIRNTPLVIQAFWLFFGLASLQIHMPALFAAILTLTINVTAYTTEILRAGIEAVPKSQIEAADCLALTRRQVIWHVVLPQAVQKMYPSLISQFILMMLASSIMSQISAEELTAVGYRIQSETFRGFEVYIVIAVIYFVLSWLMRLTMEWTARLAFPNQRHFGNSR